MLDWILVYLVVFIFVFIFQYMVTFFTPLKKETAVKQKREINQEGEN